MPTRLPMKDALCKPPCHLTLLQLVYLVSTQTWQPKSMRLPSHLSPHVGLEKEVGKVEPVCPCWGVNHGSVVPCGSAPSKAGGSSEERSQHTCFTSLLLSPTKSGNGKGSVGTHPVRHPQTPKVLPKGRTAHTPTALIVTGTSSLGDVLCIATALQREMKLLAGGGSGWSGAETPWTNVLEVISCRGSSAAWRLFVLIVVL